jgi:hypothetical protein
MSDGEPIFVFRSGPIELTPEASRMIERWRTLIYDHAAKQQGRADDRRSPDSSVAKTLARRPRRRRK